MEENHHSFPSNLWYQNHQKITVLCDGIGQEYENSPSGSWSFSWDSAQHWQFVVSLLCLEGKKRMSIIIVHKNFPVNSDSS